MAFSINFRAISPSRKLTQWWGGVLPIRNIVDISRRHKSTENSITVPLRLILPSKIPFEWANPRQPASTTDETNELLFDLNIYNIQADNMRIVDKTRRDTRILFGQDYSRNWTVSNFTNIVLAEQIRFSTLRDSQDPATKAPYNLLQNLQWFQYFRFFYDNFKADPQAPYNKWKQIGKGPIIDYPLPTRDKARVNIEILTAYLENL